MNNWRIHVIKKELEKLKEQLEQGRGFSTEYTEKIVKSFNEHPLNKELKRLLNNK